jgi:hypothetical protein
MSRVLILPVKAPGVNYTVAANFVQVHTITGSLIPLTHINLVMKKLQAAPLATLGLHTSQACQKEQHE